MTSSFSGAERTGGVNEPAAGAHAGASALSSSSWAARLFRRARLGGPFQVRAAAPGAGAAAGRIDEHAIVGLPSGELRTACF